MVLRCGGLVLGAGQRVDNTGKVKRGGGLAGHLHGCKGRHIFACCCRKVSADKDTLVGCMITGAEWRHP